LPARRESCGKTRNGDRISNETLTGKQEAELGNTIRMKFISQKQHWLLNNEHNGASPSLIRVPDLGEEDVRFKAANRW
jgi:hypothetical protein